MKTCIICRFEVELDDVVVGNEGTRCICLHCWTRETGSEQPMSKKLQREIRAALADIQVA